MVPVGDRLRHDLLERGPRRVEGRGVRRPQVDLVAARRGDHVGARSTGDDTDVDGDAGPATVQRLEAFHLPCGGEDRVAALLGLDAGMCSAACEHDLRVGDPLACRHDVAVRPRTLQDECHVVLRDQAADVIGRERRPDLLVRVGHERHRWPGARGVEGFKGVEPGEEPGLHIGHARSVGSSALRTIGTRGRGPGLEDGVHVADEEQARPMAREPADDQIAELRRAVDRDVENALDARTTGGQLGGDVVRHAVDARRGVGPAVEVDERRQLVEVAVVGGGHRRGKQLRIDRHPASL